MIGQRAEPLSVRENIYSYGCYFMSIIMMCWEFEEDPTKEIALRLEPGDLLYMPAYWFHYTYSYDINISYSHFFTEPIQ